jgi:putative transposase
MNQHPKEFQWKNRKYLRLKDYDYSTPGAYFITVCTNDHASIIEKEDRDIIQSCWDKLPSHYPNINLDEFIIMPDHMHGIIVINDIHAREGLRPSPTENNDDKSYSLFEIVRGFKSFSAREINKKYHISGRQFWQRGYYEYIIRDENELEYIRQYIRSNPNQQGKEE